MALTQDLRKAQLAFQVTGRDLDEFEVLRYRGAEGLCRMYRFEIELAHSGEGVGLEDVSGKPARLSINATGGMRHFHGMVSRFELADETTDQVYYRAELVPAPWLLAHRYNSRIFQNKLVGEIITDVLSKAGIASDRFRLTLSRSYAPRVYCVQYRETDYNFLARLMEEEGIFWFFEQTEDAHVLVMADALSAYSPIPGEVALPYRRPSGMNVDQEHVFRFRLGQSVRPGSVVLNDFNFEKPELNLQSTYDAGRDTALEFCDYPGEFAEQAQGRALAQLRVEEFETGRILGVGQSNCHRLAPGRTFDLCEFPREAANGSYLITSVVHEGRQATTRATSGTHSRDSVLGTRLHQSIQAARGHADATIRELAEGLLTISERLRAGDRTAHRALTQWLYHAGQVSRDLPATASASGGSPVEPLTIPNLLDDLVRTAGAAFEGPVYECRFECIPSSVPYRPARVTPWPIMRGTQTARVVGPSGEEIHTDEYGRVKVQFNWEREGGFSENASCWIRVSQGFAGGTYGMMFLPRVGQEVIVDFLEGDPDKPIITGRVYNADHMPPYELPKEKTKSVIKTRSSKGGGGSNEIRFEDLEGEEQILIYGEKDLHIRAKNDRVEAIENDRHLTVGNSRFEKVQKNYHLQVAEGNHVVEVGGDQSRTVDGKVSVDVGGARSTSVGGDVVDTFAANHKHEVTLTYAAKATSIKLEASAGIEFKCGGSAIVLTPAAIFITGGPLVNINSGSGPPVGPVTVAGSSPETVTAPAGADTVEHGQDRRYDGVEVTSEAEEEPVPERTWISIELKDEEGNPIGFEPYDITPPGGDVIHGTLNRKGKARISGIDPGTCQVSFPDIDGREWKKV